MSKPAASAKPVLPAATVVLLRDGTHGIETFMLARHQAEAMAFSGAFVFPGGKVDPQDAAPEWADRAPPTPATPDRPFWIAAVRETFEEAGLLLARKPGDPALLDAQSAHRIVEAERAGVEAGRSAPFHEVIEREGLMAAVDLMIHFAHWITPPWAPRRFDTHFFLLAAPIEQVGLFDAGESSEGLWIRPADALREADEGRRTLVPVTRFTLELLSTWADVDQAVSAARRRPVVTVMPRMEQVEGGRVLRIPEEAGYVTSELFIRGS